MRFLRRALFFVVALVAVIFAVTNRQAATVSLWPLPFEATLPLYLVVLGAAAIGLLVGVAASWLSKERMWLRARSAEKQAESWKRRAAERDARASAPRSTALAPARIDDE